MTAKAITQPNSLAESIAPTVNIADEVGDYIEDESAAHELEHTLDQKFKAVEESARKADGLFKTSNRAFYEHLVELLLFWIEAKDVPDYLAGLVKQRTDKKYKAKVNHGYNFAPIINIVWEGLGNKDIATNKSNRLSKALNHLHAEYVRDPKHQVNPVKSLADYIVRNGGINGIIEIKSKVSPDELTSDLENDAETIKHAAECRALAAEKAYKESLQHFRMSLSLPRVTFEEEPVLNEDLLSLVLVNRNERQELAVVGSVTDRSQIAQLITDQYTKDYSALPFPLRFISEMLTTQCLPVTWQATYKRLMEEANRSTDVSMKRSVRRLFYKSRSEQFILSSLRTNSSIVTIGYPKQPIFEESRGDVFLLNLNRVAIERHLVSPRHFKNVGVLTGSHNAPISSGSSFAHEARYALERDAGSLAQSLPVTFSFDDHVDGPVRYQVDINEQAIQKPEWQRQVPGSWFKEFNARFTNPWIASHGRHVTRPHQSIIEVNFRKNELVIRFFKADELPELSVLIPVPSALGSKPANKNFLSKDFATVMHALGDLQLEGPAEVTLVDDALELRYSTGAGRYQIYIPACDDIGTRLTTSFSKYALAYPEREPWEQDEDVDPDADIEEAL